jgi:hypothetical protein
MPPSIGVGIVTRIIEKDPHYYHSVGLFCMRLDKITDCIYTNTILT